MRQWKAFFKKEWMEMFRTGKGIVLLMIFLLLGIMNPAIAKLTPLLMETLSESMKDQGIVITEVTVDALTSWTQFFKNIPMGLFALVILFSGILTTEYARGTLINMLTKGLSRRKVISSKWMILAFVWTVSYWSCFGLTYVYNIYFWDNSIAKHLGLSSCCLFLFGFWLIALILMISCIFRANFAVLLTVGGVVAFCMLVSMIPSIAKYLPTQLMNAGSITLAGAPSKDFIPAIAVTIVTTIIFLVVAIRQFDHKKI